MIYFLFLLIPLDEDFLFMLDYLDARNVLNIPEIAPYSFEVLKSKIRNPEIEEERFYLNYLERYFKGVKEKALRFYPQVVFYPDSFLFRCNFLIYGKLRNLEYTALHRANFFKGFDTLSFDGKPWKEKIIVEIPEARISMNFSWFKVFIGRARTSIGHFWQDGLFLSSPVGIDQAGYYVDILRYLKFYYMLGFLERGRYFAFHRLAYRTRRLRIGVSEGVVMSDYFFPIYLNPVAFYYVLQWNNRTDHNIVWSADISYYFNKNRIYTELLVDDFSYERDSPDKLGVTAGVFITQFKKIRLRAEYTAIQKWVYAHRIDENNYTIRGRLLGHFLGPDGDILSLEISLPFIKEYNRIFALIQHRRKGEGSIWVDYTEEKGEIYPPFPSGVVETSILLKIGTIFFIGRFYERVEAGIKNVYNKDHTRGEDESLFILKIQSILRF